MSNFQPLEDVIFTFQTRKIKAWASNLLHLQMLGLKLYTCRGNVYPLDVVTRGSETQLQAVKLFLQAVKLFLSRSIRLGRFNTEVIFTWSCDSRQRETTSSGYKLCNFSFQVSIRLGRFNTAYAVRSPQKENNHFKQIQVKSIGWVSNCVYSYTTKYLRGVMWLRWLTTTYMTLRGHHAISRMKGGRGGVFFKSRFSVNSD